MYFITKGVIVNLEPPNICCNHKEDGIKWGVICFSLVSGEITNTLGLVIILATSFPIALKYSNEPIIKNMSSSLYNLEILILFLL